MKAYQIKIAIKDSHPPIWRRAIIPAGLSFSQLSVILNEIMGWCGYHLSMFEFFHLKIQIEEEPEECFWSEYDKLDAAETRIDEFLDEEEWFTYLYDFGDGWSHRVTIEKRLDDYEYNYPMVLKFKGDTPYEDCGGLWGHYRLLEILENPKHPEYEDMKAWVDGHFHIDYDLKQVNDALKKLYISEKTSKPMSQNQIYQEFIQDQAPLKRILFDVSTPSKFDAGCVPQGVWATFQHLSEQCYLQIAGINKDASCWERAYEQFKQIAKSVQGENDGERKRLIEIDDSTDFEFDLAGWLEDYMDFLGVKKQYDKLIQVCDEVLELFAWDEGEDSEILFQKIITYGLLEENEKAYELSKEWLIEQPNNILADAALIHACIALKKLEEAEQIVKKYINSKTKCNEDNDIIFVAAHILSVVKGDKKEEKRLEKEMQRYEQRLKEEFFALEEDDDDEMFIDFDDLPF